jgi:hypothetical protein
MCRYACDLQPMLKVLAGHEHIDKLLNIHNSVRFNSRTQRSLCAPSLVPFYRELN